MAMRSLVGCALVLAAMGCGEASPRAVEAILEIPAPRSDLWFGELRTAEGHLLIVRESHSIWTVAVLGDAPAARRDLVFQAPEGWSIANLVLLDRGATDDLLVRVDRPAELGGPGLAAAEQVWRVDGQTLSSTLLLELELGGVCSRHPTAQSSPSALVLGTAEVVGVLFGACIEDGPPLTYRMDLSELEGLGRDPCRARECLRVLDGLPPLTTASMAFETAETTRVYLTRSEPLDHWFRAVLVGASCQAGEACELVDDYGGVDWFTADTAEAVFAPQPMAFALVDNSNGPLLRMTASSADRVEAPLPSRIWQQFVREGGGGPARYLLRGTDPERYEFQVDRIEIDATSSTSSSFGGWGREEQYFAAMAHASTAIRGVTVVTTEVNRRTARVYHFE